MTTCMSKLSDVVLLNELSGDDDAGEFIYKWQFLTANFNRWVTIVGANKSTFSPSIAELPNPEGLSLFRAYVSADNGTPDDASDDCWQFSTAAVGLRISLDGSCFILPVEWLAFSADAGAKSVDLQWETTYEPDNEGFHIERSPDGNDWAVIGEQAPLESNLYELTDEDPLPGENYYRVRQTDFDGTTTYSPVKVVTFTGEVARISVFPNPVINNFFTAIIPDAFGKNVDLSLFDATGRRLPLGSSETGSGTRIETSDLARGMYLLRARSEDGKLVQTVRVVR